MQTQMPETETENEEMIEEMKEARIEQYERMAARHLFEEGWNVDAVKFAMNVAPMLQRKSVER